MSVQTMVRGGRALGALTDPRSMSHGMCVASTTMLLASDLQIGKISCPYPSLLDYL